MNRYIELLTKAGVENYYVTTEKQESVELFFVKKKLDMRRMKKTNNVSIAVFKDMEEDGKKMRGRADIILDSSMTDEEILDKIKSAVYAAEFVKNPYFDFPEKEVSDEVCPESTLNGLSLIQIADRFVDAVYEKDEDQDAFINSFEIFAEEKHVHIVNSMGADVSYAKRNVNGEFVVQCKEPQDVETYQSFRYDSLALDDIKELVATTLQMTKDRAQATDMPKAGTISVIISDKYMAELMSFYGTRAHAAYIYQGYSNYEVGTNVQGADVKGDKLNIKLASTVPFDDDAVRMTEREFVKDGELQTIHGSMRFMRYLGKEPIGTFNKLIIPAGNMTMEDMKKGPCLHVVNFSDFQMDAMGGHFGGEIRLAYYYDGQGNMKCVTGGSVNGSIFEAQKELYFSEELQELEGYSGPRAVLIKDVAVAGE